MSSQKEQVSYRAFIHNYTEQREEISSVYQVFRNTIEDQRRSLPILKASVPHQCVQSVSQLSVQKNSCISGYSNSFLTNSLIFAEVVAAANSILGIVLCFRGVTLGRVR